ILNHQVMKEVEDTVSDEPGDSQPQILLEPRHRGQKKDARRQALACQRRCRTAHSGKQYVVRGDRGKHHRIEKTLAIEPDQHPEKDARCRGQYNSDQIFQYISSFLPPCPYRAVWIWSSLYPISTVDPCHGI